MVCTRLSTKDVFRADYMHVVNSTAPGLLLSENFPRAWRKRLRWTCCSTAIGPPCKYVAFEQGILQLNLATANVFCHRHKHASGLRTTENLLDGKLLLRSDERLCEHIELQ